MRGDWALPLGLLAWSVVWSLSVVADLLLERCTFAPGGNTLECWMQGLNDIVTITFSRLDYSGLTMASTESPSFAKPTRRPTPYIWTDDDSPEAQMRICKLYLEITEKPSMWDPWKDTPDQRCKAYIDADYRPWVRKPRVSVVFDQEMSNCYQLMRQREENDVSWSDRLYETESILEGDSDVPEMLFWKFRGTTLASTEHFLTHKDPVPYNESVLRALLEREAAYANQQLADAMGPPAETYPCPGDGCVATHEVTPRVWPVEPYEAPRVLECSGYGEMPEFSMDKFRRQCVEEWHGTWIDHGDKMACDVQMRICECECEREDPCVSLAWEVQRKNEVAVWEMRRKNNMQVAVIDPPKCVWADAPLVADPVVFPPLNDSNFHKLMNTEMPFADFWIGSSLDKSCEPSAWNFDCESWFVYL